ncbi:hypothetical protein LWI28_012285 [Acer negundo]|uniref:Uncharacterized protein n=1 Tax=Acer negundo TaxID=4023 RepID=A0AAD5JJ90_ACENE|nr:hypothetical protein LWI28_012285 [Acer negundo]
MLVLIELILEVFFQEDSTPWFYGQGQQNRATELRSVYLLVEVIELASLVKHASLVGGTWVEAPLGEELALTVDAPLVVASLKIGVMQASLVATSSLLSSKTPQARSFSLVVEEATMALGDSPPPATSNPDLDPPTNRDDNHKMKNIKIDRKRIWIWIWIHWANVSYIYQQLKSIMLALSGFYRLYLLYLQQLSKPPGSGSN